MEQNIDKKVDRVIGSFKGSARAQPSPELYDRIASKIFQQEASMIPIRTIWLSIAAAVLLIFINIAAISSNTMNQKSGLDQNKTADSYSVLSNYNIYE